MIDVDATLPRLLTAIAFFFALAWIALPFVLLSVRNLLREILSELRAIKDASRKQ